MRSLMALGLCAGLAVSASAQIHLFDGFNHPGGNVDNQEYGLRLDNFGPDSQVTFSFERDGLSTVTIALDTDAETVSLRGTVWGNSAENGTLLGSYDLDVTFSGSWDEGASLFTVRTTSPDIGTLTARDDVTVDSPLDAGESMTLMSKARSNGDVFLFGADGVPGGRLDSGTDLYEGYGWVKSTESSGTQDFLFTARFRSTVVPSPGTAALLAAGGIVALRRRR